MTRTRKAVLFSALIAAGGVALVALQPARTLRADPKPEVCNGVTCRPNEVCCVVDCPPVLACTPKAGKGECPPLRPCAPPVQPPNSSQD